MRQARFFGISRLAAWHQGDWRLDTFVMRGGLIAAGLRASRHARTQEN
jgi:hypothetical protein